MKILVQEQEKSKVPAQAERMKKDAFLLALPFCSIQSLSGLDDAHHIGGSPIGDFAESPSQKLISSGNTLTDTPSLGILWPGQVDTYN